MYPELEPIAQLEYVKAIEEIVRDLNEQRRAKRAEASARGMYKSGATLKALANFQVEHARRQFQAIARIWRNLIRASTGTITEDDVNFICFKVDSCVTALSNPKGLD